MARNPFLWWLPPGSDEKPATEKPAAKKTPARKADAPKTQKKTPSNKAAADKATAGKAEVAQASPKPSAKPSAAPAIVPAGTEETPGHLIRRAQQIAVAIFLEECAAAELTPMQYAALVAVRDNPGADATRIAGLVAFDRTTISGVLERLEAKGLIARTANEADRRAKLLQATAAGRKLLKKAAPMVEAAQLRILSPLSVPEQAEIMRLLAKLVDLNNDSSRAPRRVAEAE